MKEIFCPWASGSRSAAIARLQTLCRYRLGTAHRHEDASLADFLTSSSAKAYFKQGVWGAYGSEWKWVALLALLKIWTTDLEHVNYGRSDEIFEENIDGLKLNRLSSPGGSVLFVDNGSNQESATNITRYSEETWTILLQYNERSDRSNRSLSVTLSEGELCIQNLVCLDARNLEQNRHKITEHLKDFDIGKFGSFLNLLLKEAQNKWSSKKTFMALIAACFKDVGKVSFTVLRPSEGGKQIFKQLK